ncbi:unnamed protein product [Urochloa decumbens]|uniref:F-box domain-containing protein n=1 Tax=Urochloa decumbens TaxID=240449 RepID=A0ABC9H436_9POAL
MAKQNNVPCRRTTIHDIPDDLLQLTFLHIPSPADIIRAAATCKVWRRVIGNADFLLRFRRHHGPHILGHYYTKYGRTDFFPCPAPAGQIAVDDDTVSDRTCLYFLTTSYYNLNSAELHDSRGGLLAFHHDSRRAPLIVCNPWTREHRKIYRPMPTRATTYTLSFLGIFLLDPEPGDGEIGMDLDMSNFRVLCVRLACCYHDGRKTAEASVFSASQEHWLLLSNTMAIADDILPEFYLVDQPLFVLVGRASGSICWCTRTSSNVILHLDESTGEFSLFTLPVHAGVNMDTLLYRRANLRVIGGDIVGTTRLVRILGGNLEVLQYAHGSGSCDSGVCAVERRICLPCLFAEPQPLVWCFADRADGVEACGSVALCDVLCDDAEFIRNRKLAADVKNLRMERVEWLSDGGWSFPYEMTQ